MYMKNVFPVRCYSVALLKYTSADYLLYFYFYNGRYIYYIIVMSHDL